MASMNLETREMDDWTRNLLRLRQFIWRTHQEFPLVKESDLMKVVLILHRGCVNPGKVEEIIKEVFDESVH
jgi:hypothetical protein